MGGVRHSLYDNGHRQAQAVATGVLAISFHRRHPPPRYHTIKIFAHLCTPTGRTQINEPWLVWIGIFDLLTFKIFPIVRFIQARLIPTVQCSHCQGNPIPLKDHWQCSCGYSSQISRHVFLPCTQCGKIFTFINCDCGIGILV